MPRCRKLRVIAGGRSSDAATPVAHSSSRAAGEFLERTAYYRKLLGERPDSELSSLISDMEDAIQALRRLESSTDPEALLRVVEYRRLIAELEVEIVAALQAP